MVAGFVGALVGLGGAAGLQLFGMELGSALAAGTLLGVAWGIAAQGALAAPPVLAERLRWLLWPQAALVVVVTWLAYLHLLPPGGLLSLPYADKVLHFTLFGLVAFFAELWLRGRRIGPVPVAIALPMGLAALEELAQTLSPHRTADLTDLLCDLAGMCLAWTVAQALRTAPSAQAAAAPARHEAAR